MEIPPGDVGQVEREEVKDLCSTGWREQRCVRWPTGSAQEGRQKVRDDQGWEVLGVVNETWTRFLSRARGAPGILDSSLFPNHCSFPPISKSNATYWSAWTPGSPPGLLLFRILVCFKRWEREGDHQRSQNLIKSNTKYFRFYYI